MWVQYFTESFGVYWDYSICLAYWICGKAMPVSLVPSHSYSPPICLLLELPLFSFEVMEALAAHGPTEEQLFHRLVCCIGTIFHKHLPHIYSSSVLPLRVRIMKPPHFTETIHYSPWILWTGTVHNLYLLHHRHSTLSSPGQISICPILALSCKPLSWRLFPSASTEDKTVWASTHYAAQLTRLKSVSCDCFQYSHRTVKTPPQY